MQQIEHLMKKNIPLLQLGDSLEKAINLLRIQKLDALPIVDKTGSLIGAFTKANIMDAYLAGVSISEPVENYCTSQVAKLHLDFPLSLVKARLMKNPTGNGFVIGNNGTVLGMLDKSTMVENLLVENEQLLMRIDTLCNNYFAGIIFLDTNNQIKDVNRMAENILGISDNELIGRSFYDVAENLDMNDIYLNSFDMFGLKLRINGVETISNISVINYKSTVIGAIITFLNAESNYLFLEKFDQLKRWDKSFRTVLNVIYESVLVTDNKGKILYVNKALCEFLGKPGDDLVGKSINGLAISSSIYRVLHSGIALKEEAGINKLNGRLYVMSIIPIIKRDKIQGSVCMIAYHSIEELTEVSKRLLQLESNTIDNTEKTSGSITFNYFITMNNYMQNLKEEAKLAAKGKSTILITGESGTGKEVIAEAIHNASPRRGKPLITVNCAAIPDNLLEAEFFGYAPGAFTGADKRGKKGKFMAADGGTLFLDEIGDMSLNLQSKLLRVLENKRVEPVGSNESIAVDVRIMAATNQDLNAKVITGEFRQDLYYRLNVINLQLLPLRQRKEDIIPLVEFFINKFNRGQNKQIKALSNEVRQIFLNYGWPGNVRELANIVERATTYASGNQIELKDLPLYLREPHIKTLPHPSTLKNETISNQIMELNKETIKKALNDAKGNKSEAAKMLGISRTWLYENIRKYDL